MQVVGFTRQGKAVTDDERAVIELAAASFRYPAVREARALEELGLTPTKFWALVHHLIDRPDVVAAMPVETARLRRLRDRRRAVRRTRP